MALPQTVGFQVLLGHYRNRLLPLNRLCEHGNPLIFGKNRDKGIRMNGQRPEVVTLGNGVSESDIVVHDESNLSLAFMLANFEAPMPTPLGVFYATSRPTYEGAINKQLEDAKAKTGPGDLKKLLSSGDTWRVN
jgi:2-oxoglutarate ferredoxin oxidoreductase subunit beta